MKKLFAVLGVIFLSSCSSDEKIGKNKTEAERLYMQAEEQIEFERYTLAIEKLNTIRNEHPYSKFATLALLRLGDVYFLQESYGEAGSQYQAFRDLHPKHEKIEYVMFQLASSYYKNLPDTIDRDLGNADKAIAIAEELVASFPGSAFRTQALEIKDKAYSKLLEKEDYIGNFYFIRDIWASAHRRYEYLRKKFPNSRLDDKALYRMGYSLYKLKKESEAKKVLEELQSKHPDSDYTKDLRKSLG